LKIAISPKYYRLGLLAGLGLSLAGCASDKSLVSHALNNVAARDNGFFSNLRPFSAKQVPKAE
jgi:hypothetical protein